MNEKADNVSVVIIAQNEGRIISRCLESAAWAAEIIVVDGGSTDDTVKTALAYGAKVFQHKFEGYVEQKNFAISKASNEWVLSVDADEIIEKPLSEEILSAVKNAGAFDGYYIPRKNFYYTNRFLRFGGLYPDRQLRLFRKGKGIFEGGRIHEGLKLRGEAGALKNALLHYTKPGIEAHINTVNRYTGLEAEKSLSEGKRATGYTLLIKPAAYFIKHYFLKLGFLDGPEGLIYHLISAHYVFIKEIKLAEKQGLNNIKPMSTILDRGKNKGGR